MASAVSTPRQNENGVPRPSSNRSRSSYLRSSIHGHGNGDDPRSKEGLGRPTKWSMGILNDSETNEVPGSVLLLAGARNEPLGIDQAPRRKASSTLPVQEPFSSRRQSHQSKSVEGKKLTKDGQIILEPQPEDSHNDPLNWSAWKRDIALLSLGIFCMVGGGMTPILAAGFTNVASTYHVTVPQVALTTGLYMMGMGLGSVFASPTAILFGKRPVYLVGAFLFIATSIWCAVSPSYISLVLARIFQGISISPVECLPSATIAEIFFLHERAFRIGIYTLLLLGGKNLVPLVSAAIIQTFGWRWVFWICAMVGGFCWVLLFLFVPETFWDRSPVPRLIRKLSNGTLNTSHFTLHLFGGHKAVKSSTPQETSLSNEADGNFDPNQAQPLTSPMSDTAPQQPSLSLHVNHHVGFAEDHVQTGDANIDRKETGSDTQHGRAGSFPTAQTQKDFRPSEHPRFTTDNGLDLLPVIPAIPGLEDRDTTSATPPTPWLHTVNSPFYNDVERKQSSFFATPKSPDRAQQPNITEMTSRADIEKNPSLYPSSLHPSSGYTALRRDAPQLSFTQQLKPFNGRLKRDTWLRVAVRPFILYSYPAVLWSSVVYSCSVGWLIVLSESMTLVFRNRTTYGFTALSTGLIYISPFIGGILGTAVAGKLSDVIVKAMARRNGGLYEPEFRLVMAIPITIATAIGLMGFGWSAEIHDKWIVPTIFFGIISFGCSLGSTTAITFCVDSYRQYAGEALVTLNFSKNIFHGLAFSLFFPAWLQKKGSKSVFIWLGVIQLVLMAFTVPMYIFGKRARMWTVRKNFMERF